MKTKTMSASRAKNYMAEWMNVTAIKKLSHDAGYIYFTFKDKGEDKLARVDIQPDEFDGECSWNIWTRNNATDIWEWTDCIMQNEEVIYA